MTWRRISVSGGILVAVLTVLPAGSAAGQAAPVPRALVRPLRFSLGGYASVTASTPGQAGYGLSALLALSRHLQLHGLYGHAGAADRGALALQWRPRREGLTPYVGAGIVYGATRRAGAAGTVTHGLGGMALAGLELPAVLLRGLGPGVQVRAYVEAQGYSRGPSAVPLLVGLRFAPLQLRHADDQD